MAEERNTASFGNPNAELVGIFSDDATCCSWFFCEKTLFVFAKS